MANQRDDDGVAVFIAARLASSRRFFLICGEQGAPASGEPSAPRNYLIFSRLFVSAAPRRNFSPRSLARHSRRRYALAFSLFLSFSVPPAGFQETE